MMEDSSTRYNEGLGPISTQSDGLMESYGISDRDPQRVNINFLRRLARLGRLSTNPLWICDFLASFCSPDAGHLPPTPLYTESSDSPSLHTEKDIAAFLSSSGWPASYYTTPPCYRPGTWCEAS